MKKSSHLIILSLVLLICSATFVSCVIFDYSLYEAFYRPMKVEDRARKIEKLNISVDQTGSKIRTNMQNELGEEKPLVIRSDDSYNVLIITDVHFGNPSCAQDGIRHDSDWFKMLESKKTEKGERFLDTVKFAVGLGDFAEHGYLEECQDYNKNIRDRLEKEYGIPLFNIVGNHDLYNSGWNNWKTTMFPHTSFYKFETPSFSWYFLDSASGTLGEYQFDALRKEMLNDSKKKLVFSHIPLYADNYLYFSLQNTDERNRLISTLAETSARYFIEGHSHEKRSYDFGAFTEMNIADFALSRSYGILQVNESDKTAFFHDEKY